MIESARILSSLLAPAALQFRVELSGSLPSALSRYASLLLEWNQRINLTGARDLHTLATEHLADAFALVPHLPSSGRCVDVGSGAGLPGIVLALVRPDLRIQLLEPTQKRRAFLAAVIRGLAVGNVEVCADRLEEHASKVGAAYDFAVARAVFPLEVWLQRGRGLVKPGGVLAGMAGGASPVLPCPDACAHAYDVGAGPRAVVLVRM